MGARTGLRRAAATGLAGALVLAAACTKDLGTLGGTWSEATDVNASGLVVGVAGALVPSDAGDLPRAHAVVQQGDGPLQDIHGGDRYMSHASAVNDGGVVVGYTADKSPQSSYPFRWSAATGWEELPRPAGRAWAEAVDIDVQGNILVRTYPTPADREPGRAWILDAKTGIYTVLPDLGFGADPAAMNDAGQIVGTVWVSDDQLGHAATWEPRTRALVDLGAGSPDESAATAVNAWGHIVGWSKARDAGPATFTALRWTGPTHTRSTLGAGQPAGVNDRGLVVGTVFDAGWLGTPTLWDPATGTTRPLGGLGGTTAQAVAIDDGDVPVGVANNAEGDRRAVTFDRYEG